MSSRGKWGERRDVQYTVSYVGIHVKDTGKPPTHRNGSHHTRARRGAALYVCIRFKTRVARCVIFPESDVSKCRAEEAGRGTVIACGNREKERVAKKRNIDWVEKSREERRKIFLRRVTRVARRRVAAETRLRGNSWSRIARGGTDAREISFANSCGLCARHGTFNFARKSGRIGDARHSAPDASRRRRRRLSSSGRMTVRPRSRATSRARASDSYLLPGDRGLRGKEPDAEIYDVGEFTASGSRHVKCVSRGEGVNSDSIERETY